MSGAHRELLVLQHPFPSRRSTDMSHIIMRPKGSTAVATPESLDFNYPRAKEVADPVAATGDTTHFDINDRHGNMISGTPSGTSLHMSPVVSEIGRAHV